LARFYDFDGRIDGQHSHSDICLKRDIGSVHDEGFGDLGLDRAKTKVQSEEELSEVRLPMLKWMRLRVPWRQKLEA
jgi:hypothetical protein